MNHAVAELLTIVLIAVGLAMDAFAVAVSSGFAIKKLHVRYALKIACFFGGFQGIMPVIGWLAGLTVRQYVAHVDHWIAFGLLTLIGAKMIYETGVIEKAEREVERVVPVRDAWPGAEPEETMTVGNQHSLYTLLVLSVATSIDALIVGMSLSLVTTGIAVPALVIGLVTFGMALGGVYLGQRVGHFFEKRIGIVGGVILIGIGIKILAAHVFGA
jgi:putative Mn2+ efflux pump MntP